MEYNEMALVDVVNIKTGKLNSNAAVENGEYPFFTCAPEPLRIDRYKYDQSAILLAGNNADGNFHINYFEGKFEAYQRTYIIDSKNVDSYDLKYIFYALKECLHEFKLMSQGTSTKFLTMAILNSFKLKIPGIEVQRKISGILSTIDEKIANNNQINRNLSEQQDVLYKLYFKDCEGEIKKVKDVVSFSQGVQVPVEEQSLVKEDGYEQFIRIVDVAQNNTDIRFVKDTNRGKITEYDVFMVRYGSQTAGMIARGKRGIIANNLFTINSDELSEEYLFCYFGSDTVKNYLKGNSASSTMPAINFGTLNAMDILIPSKIKMDEFTVVARSLFEKKLLVEKEIEKLTKLRESLLPKLMSGELDVSDLEI